MGGSSLSAALHFLGLGRGDGEEVTVVDNDLVGVAIVVVDLVCVFTLATACAVQHTAVGFGL